MKTSQELREFALDSIAINYGLSRRALDPSTLKVVTTTTFENGCKTSQRSGEGTVGTRIEFAAHLFEEENHDWEREYHVSHNFKGDLFDALEKLGL